MNSNPATRMLYPLALTVVLLTGCSDGVVVNDSGAATGANPATGGANNPNTPNPAPINTGDPDAGPETPAVAPDTSDYNAGALDAADVDAARFLTQASFGPSLESIEAFRSYGSIDAWIDWQVSLPVSTTKGYTQANSNGSLTGPRHDGWWNNALDEDDQLRQRMAFALSQLFVISDVDYALSNAQYGVTDYYDMLSRGSFGNFRTLLGDVTLHPAMGVYLSMVRNEKADLERNIRPDENYAREVMQLFTLGLFEMNMRGEPVPLGNPRPTYTQTDVEEFARVFTGWNYPNIRYWTDNRIGPENFEGPMGPNEEFHDSGSKNLLNGTVSPAGLSAREDLNLALDNLFQHPNVPPFVSRHLIQRLVTSNPTPEYIERVARVFADNGNGERGDLEAVLRAILKDEEARSGHLTLTNFGKLKEPMMRWTQLWRALGATPGPLSEGVHRTANHALSQFDSMTGQAVLRSKSVFNFYSPSNPLSAGSQLLSPEMQIMTEGNLAATHNNWHHQVYRFNNRSDLTDDNPRVTVINLEPLGELGRDRNALLDRYNLLLFAGGMPTNMRQTLFDFSRSYPTTRDGRFAMAQDMLFMILTTPQIQWQR